MGRPALAGDDRPNRPAENAFLDSRVESTAFIAAGDDLVAAVQQQVFDLSGAPLTDTTSVYHRYSFAGELVRRMVVYVDRVEALAVG